MPDTKIIENAYYIYETAPTTHVYNYTESSTESPRTIKTPVFGTVDNGVVYTDTPVPVQLPFTAGTVSPNDCDLTSLNVQTLTGSSSIVNVYDSGTDTYHLERDGSRFTNITSYGMEIYFTFGVFDAVLSNGSWVTDGDNGFYVYKDQNGDIQFTRGTALGAGVLLLNSHWTMPDVRFSISETVS